MNCLRLAALVVACAGTVAPCCAQVRTIALAGPSTCLDCNFDDFSDPVISSDGRVAFWGVTRDGAMDGLWVATPGASQNDDPTYDAAVIVGDSIPGVGTVGAIGRARKSEFRLASGGQAVVNVLLSPVSELRESLQYYDGFSRSTIVTTGDLIADRPGWKYKGLVEVSNGVAIAMNNSGSVVFASFVEDVFQQTNTAVFSWSPTFGLQTIVMGSESLVAGLQFDLVRSLDTTSNGDVALQASETSTNGGGVSQYRLTRQGSTWLPELAIHQPRALTKMAIASSGELAWMLPDLSPDPGNPCRDRAFSYDTSLTQSFTSGDVAPGTAGALWSDENAFGIACGPRITSDRQGPVWGTLGSFVWRELQYTDPVTQPTHGVWYRSTIGAVTNIMLDEQSISPWLPGTASSVKFGLEPESGPWTVASNVSDKYFIQSYYNDPDEVLGTQCSDIDFNNDGLFPDDLDLIDYNSVLAGGPCSTNDCDTIDFNRDGLFPDDEDLVCFLRILSGATDCPSCLKEYDGAKIIVWGTSTNSARGVAFRANDNISVMPFSSGTRVIRDLKLGAGFLDRVINNKGGTGAVSDTCSSAVVTAELRELERAILVYSADCAP
jgi:hypothetical protein